MSYKINNIDLATFGIIPLQGTESVAVSGLLDFPSRDGATERSWGVGTEAFVSAADLKWKERDLTFQGLAQAATNTALLINLAGFSALCKSDLLHFETPYGAFEVILKNGIKVGRINPKTAEVDANFTQPVAVFPALVQIASGGTGYRLAGFNLKNDFGIYVSDSAGLQDTSSRIEVKTTVDYLKTAYREPGDLSISCFMQQPTIAGIVAKMGQFQSLLASSGLKTFIDTEGKSYSVYVKDGFKVLVHAGTNAIASFTLKLRSI